MRTIIIAEAGVNHNGSLQLAKQLIDVAVDAGVDIIKFQTFKASNLVTKTATQAEYQMKNSLSKDKSQYEMLKKLELSDKDHKILIKYCSDRNIKFLSTAFDIESIEYLHSLNMGMWKIPSGEITNLPYLEKIGSFNEEVILSTGMANIEDIQLAINAIVTSGTLKDQITILHCNTEYPTPMEDVNLRAMKPLGDRFNVQIGYSDHTLGIEVPIAAVALGATIIEKHFTLDRNLPGPDHKASLEPIELKQMVKSIRHIEKALGSNEKMPTQSEEKNRSIARKSIHLSQALSSGTALAAEHFIMKRPGDGISPMEYHLLIGKTLKKDVSKEYKLRWEDLE